MIASTGSELFDTLLNGGLDLGITTLYGPRGTGKTLLCVLSTLSMIKKGMKVIYIQTEKMSPTIRMKQVDPECKEMLSQILFFEPKNFDEQTHICERLRRLADDRVGLVVVDSIAPLLRLEKNTARGLGKQVAYLSNLSRKRQLPVLVTTQLYDDPEKGITKMVGGNVLTYGSSCLIELNKVYGHRYATMHKPRKQESVRFKIETAGFIVL